MECCQQTKNQIEQSEKNLKELKIKSITTRMTALSEEITRLSSATQVPNMRQIKQKQSELKNLKKELESEQQQQQPRQQQQKTKGGNTRRMKIQGSNKKTRRTI